jgi:nucleotide-binding universal stress UspA family protein
MGKILCATDEADVSRKAENHAIKLAKALGEKLCFVYVSPVSEAELETPGTFDSTILEVLEAREHKILRHAQGLARDHGYDYADAPCTIVRSRDIAWAIVDFAERGGYEHIVTGATGRVGVPRFLLGSIANEVARKAHCAVTIVR